QWALMGRRGGAIKALASGVFAVAMAMLTGCGDPAGHSSAASPTTRPARSTITPAVTPVTTTSVLTADEDALRAAVVRVRNAGPCGVGVGTGIVLNSHQLVTNAHVVE